MAGAHFTGPVRHKDHAPNPTRGNNSSREWFSNLVIAPDPDYIVYFNDFLVEQDYAAADWVITTTEAGAGSASEALAGDELNGALLITNDDADNDLDSLQHTQEVFKCASGKRLWFEARVKINDVDQVDEFIGLCVTDTTPLVATDRIGWQLDDGDATPRTVAEKDSTETTSDSDTDLADDTYVQLGFYWDGKSRAYFYQDRVLKATETSNIPDNENMCITLHHQNGEAVAQTLTVDYLYCAMER